MYFITSKEAQVLMKKAWTLLKVGKNINKKLKKTNLVDLQRVKGFCELGSLVKKLRFMGEEVVGKDEEMAINENGFKVKLKYKNS